MMNAERYWKKIAGKILVNGERGNLPCEGEILGVFNELKYQKPERDYFVSAYGFNHENLFQQGNKIKDIVIRKKFSQGHFVELIVNFQVTLRLSIQNLAPFSFSLPTVQLQETLANFDEFVDNFEKYFDKYEEEKTELAKRNKLKEISNKSIRAAVSQVLSAMPYEWNLVDRDEYFSLQVEMGPKKVVSMTLNGRNFAKRISRLADVLGRVQILLNELPFPMDITMTKEFVKL